MQVLLNIRQEYPWTSNDRPLVMATFVEGTENTIARLKTIQYGRRTKVKSSIYRPGGFVTTVFLPNVAQPAYLFRELVAEFAITAANYAYVAVTG